MKATRVVMKMLFTARTVEDPRTANSQSRLLRSDELAAGALFSLSKRADANMRARCVTSELQTERMTFDIWHLRFFIWSFVTPIAPFGGHEREPSLSARHARDLIGQITNVKCQISN